MSRPQTSVYSVTIDDDPTVAPMIEAATRQSTVAFNSSAAFRDKIDELDPMAFFVDVHLGVDDSGIDLIPQIRARRPYVPILVITSDPTSDLIGPALASGANDYIRKPIEALELIARLRARSVEMSQLVSRDTFKIGDVEINLRHNSLKGAIGTAYLSHSDVQLLEYLVQAKGTIVPREELKRRLWGTLKVTQNALDKKIHEIRRALTDVSPTVRLQSVYSKGIGLVENAEGGDGDSDEAEEGN